MNKCKKCGVEIACGDICNGCAVAEGVEIIAAILERKKLQGVKVTEVTPKHPDAKKPNAQILTH